MKNSMKMIFLAAALALVWPAAAQESKSAAPAKSGKVIVANSSDYVIGTEDLLAINVWKEPEISRTVPVRPDGRVSVPLVGDIEASGLTPKQLQTNITHALQAYITNPEVAIIVQEVRSQKFNILGEVAKPGAYSLVQPTTVLDALAQAGGFRDFAKVTRIYVLRPRADGARERLPFNYKQVVKGKKIEQNIELEPRDTIVVP